MLTENLVLHGSLLVYPDLPSAEEFALSNGFDVRNYFNWNYQLQNSERLPEGDLQPMFILASPMLSYLGVPFYIIAQAINFSPIQFTAFFLNSIILALSSTVVFAFADEIFRSKKIAFILSIVAAVCSFAWPYATNYFQQPLAGLMIISSCYFLYMASKNRFPYAAFLSGLFLGLLLLARSGELVLIPGLVILSLYIFRKNKTKIIQFFSGLLPLIGLQLYLNLLRYSSTTDFGYGAFQTLSHRSSIEGLYGLFISPGFGLITNFPLILLFPIALYFCWKKNKILCVMFLYIFTVSWLSYGTLPTPSWHGFGGWGPRLLVPIIPIIAVSLGFLLKEIPLKKIIRIMFIPLAIAGFFVNFSGAMVWYQVGYDYAFGPLKILTLPEPESVNFAWNLKFNPIVIHWIVLTTDWWEDVLPPVWYGWYSCIPDNFVYCTFGIVPITLLLATIGALGLVLIWNLKKSENKMLQT